MASTFAPEDLPERFTAMKRQEENAYKVNDYMYRRRHERGTAVGGSPSLRRPRPTSLTEAPVVNAPRSTVTEVWRVQICEWQYDVIDHLDYDREIVSIAMSFLDRFLDQRPTVDRRTFQLLGITTLYLACKLCSHHGLGLSDVLELISRDDFNEEHITKMEESILNTLSWHVHPPTSLAFARHFVFLLNPSACEPSVWHDMMEVAKFLTELAVIEYHFSPIKPSSIGLASLMIAMESVDSSRLSDGDRQAFVQNVHQVAQVSPDDPEVMDCRTRLRAMYYESDVYHQQQEAEAAAAAQAAREHQAEAAATIRSNSPSSVAEFVSTKGLFQGENDVAKNLGTEWGPDGTRPLSNDTAIANVPEDSRVLPSRKNKGEAANHSEEMKTTKKIKVVR